MSYRQGRLQPFRAELDCECSHARITHKGGVHACLMKLCGCTKFRKPSRTAAAREACEEHSHDSKFERRGCKELSYRKQAKDIKDFRAHEVIPIVINGVKVCDYEVDFVAVENDGTETYYEYKGQWLGDSRLKSKLFAAYIQGDPTKRYRVIMQR